MIERKVLKAAINDIAGIKGIQMDPQHLTLDILALAEVYNEELKFKKVVSSIIIAIVEITDDATIGDDLEHNLKGWKSFHFSSPFPKRRGEEDLRLVYKSVTNIMILAFGHRYDPDDFYRRFKNRI